MDLFDLTLEEKGKFKTLVMRTIDALEKINAVEHAPQSELLMMEIIKMQDEMTSKAFEMIDEIIEDENRNENDIVFAQSIVDEMINLMLCLNILFLGANESIQILLNLKNESLREDDNENDNEEDDDE